MLAKSRKHLPSIHLHDEPALAHRAKPVMEAAEVKRLQYRLF